MSDHEDDDDETDDRNRDRNENRDTTAGQCIQVQLGQIQSGTAVSELNLFQFCSLLIENFNARFHENTLKWPNRLARDLPKNVPTNLNHINCILQVSRHLSKVIVTSY